jgi:hypothetical protein
LASFERDRLLDQPVIHSGYVKINLPYRYVLKCELAIVVCGSALLRRISNGLYLSDWFTRAGINDATAQGDGRPLLRDYALS